MTETSSGFVSGRATELKSWPTVQLDRGARPSRLRQSVSHRVVLVPSNAHRWVKCVHRCRGLGGRQPCRTYGTRRARSPYFNFSLPLQSMLESWVVFEHEDEVHQGV
jgi:hypothetical protein